MANLKDTNAVAIPIKDPMAKEPPKTAMNLPIDLKKASILKASVAALPQDSTDLKNKE